MNEAIVSAADVYVPPQNVDAEESVLGSVLIKNDAMGELDVVAPEDFYREKHRRIFSSMRELTERGEPIDLVTLGTDLKEGGNLDAVGGEGFLAYLAGRVPTASNVLYYARLVREKSQLRSIVEGCREIAHKGCSADTKASDLLDDLERDMLVHRRSMASSSRHGVRELVGVAVDSARRAMEGDILLGLETGLLGVDQTVGGLAPSDLIVLAGRPSMGKTALWAQFATHIARSYPTLLFSLEQSREQIVQRMICQEAGVEYTLVRRGMFGEGSEKMQRYFAAAESIGARKLEISDEPMQSVGDIISQSRQFAARHVGECGLIGIDYLGLIDRPRKDSDHSEIGQITKRLKALAKELDWPVLLLHQLNRSCEKRDSKRPILSDLAESGHIEADADVVLFAFRRPYYFHDADPREAEIVAAKNRNGAVGLIPLAFDGPFMRFANE